MNLETRAKLSKLLTNILALCKILLALFLIIVVFAWLIQYFEMEHMIPFVDSMNNFLTRISAIFYTPTGDDEESYNALLYMSIAVVFFLLIFETATDILGDVLKLHARQQEQVLAEENEKINQKIQENYKQHLSTAFNFTTILKLEINNRLNNTQAFQDQQLENKIKEEEQKILKDIYSIITMSIKCPMKARPDMIILDVKNADDLNRILNFIINVCNVEKYQKYGVNYFISVTTHSPEEPATEAIESGLSLINLKNDKKILCHGVVCECLKTIKNCQFRFENNGSYSTDENETIFELVNKN